MAKRSFTPLGLKIALAVAAIVLVAAGALAVRNATDSLGQQLDETGYKNMTTYAEQCASGIGEMRLAYTNLVKTIGVSEDWQASKEATIADMQRVMSAYDVYYLSFIGADGSGFDSKGNDATIADLPCAPDTFTDLSTQQESAAYIGNTGKYEYMVQYPVTVDGKFIGDFYIGLSVTAQFNYLRDANYQLFVIDSETGRTIGSQGITAITGNTADSVYKIIDNYSTDDNKPEDADEDAASIDAAMSSQQTLIMQVHNSDVSQVCCLTPIPDTSWYVCVKANVDNINGGKESIVNLVYQLIVILMLVAIIFIAALLAFQAKADKDHERATKELESVNAMLEETAKAAESANAAKSTFLSNMSHDIRTPMNAIVGMTSMAIADSGDEAKVREDLQVIKSSSAHLLGLINDVLDLSRIESGKLVLDHSNFILSSVMSNVMSMIRPLASSKSQKLTLQIGNMQHEYLVGDPTRFKQVLINLLNNANKYTPDGGEISVRIEELAPRLPKQARFRITVSDTGIGISPDKLEEIFEPFSRVTNSTVNAVEGTGLGLTIVRQIVNAQGGTVSADSKEGLGSTFVVTIPFEIQAEGGAEVDAALKKLRILHCCNDNEGSKRVKLLLEGAVDDLQISQSSEAALEEIAKAIDRGVPFDAMLMGSENGGDDAIKTIRKVHETAPELPIVLVCKSDWAAIEKEARSLGVAAFCLRPVFRSELREVLVNVTSKRFDASTQQRYLEGVNTIVVDDNSINRMVAQMVFENASASVTVAASGEEALTIFKESEPGYFDLILMDVMMPGMDGYETTGAIRSLDRPDAATILIVAMTANAFAEDVAKAREAGMNGHIAKPVDPQVAQEMLSALLAQRQ